MHQQGEATRGRYDCGSHGTMSDSAPDAEVGRRGGGLRFLLRWITRCLCEQHRLHREQHL